MRITKFDGLSGSAFDIAAGPDGDLWFTEPDENLIGRITPSGVVTEFAVPTADALPLSIVAGPDGNLWFTEFDGNKIGRITTAGVITEVPLPTAGSAPAFLTTGLSGRLWFTEHGTREVGFIFQELLTTSELLFQATAAPGAIVIGPGSSVWFLETNAVGVFHPLIGFTEFALPFGHTTHMFSGIARGSDDLIWFTEPAHNLIGRIGLTEILTEFPLPANVGPGDIIAGPDGNLWFSANHNVIGRITTGGEVTLFKVDVPIIELVIGPDGNLWFTMEDHTIGTLTSLLQNTRSDFIGHGDDAAIFWNAQTSATVYLDINPEFGGYGSVLPSLGIPDFMAIGSGDLNGDAEPDVVFQYGGNGGIFYRAADHDLSTGWGTVAPSMPENWYARAVGDFDGDGVADVAVQESTSGNTFYADMRPTNIEMTPPTGSGATVWGVGALGLSSDWVLRGAGDLNGDGVADILFQSYSSGAVIYADMAAVNHDVATANYGDLPNTLKVVSTNLGADYLVTGVGDIDGDDTAEVIFHNSLDGSVIFAPGGLGQNPAYVMLATIPNEFHVRGMADVDGDGHSDILMQNTNGDAIYLDADATVATGTPQFGVIAVGLGTDYILL